MARKFTLRDTSEGDEGNDSDAHMIDRRQFMRHSFNTAAGVITMAGLTSVGFFKHSLWANQIPQEGTLLSDIGSQQGLRIQSGMETDTWNL